ncbi:hypothetical protein JZ751_020446 [Albula glossodonta]|uniref:Uncharacterized protein n=1 Tax=Albula glossodonta TaxID=121402 RepID=A0A8T2MY73_9TELE|nr:hypothetical protein JZ751_020446 [Albula glossodonta]
MDDATQADLTAVTASSSQSPVLVPPPPTSPWHRKRLAGQAPWEQAEVLSLGLRLAPGPQLPGTCLSPTLTPTQVTPNVPPEITQTRP